MDALPSEGEVLVPRVRITEHQAILNAILPPKHQLPDYAHLVPGGVAYPKTRQHRGGGPERGVYKSVGEVSAYSPREFRDPVTLNERRLQGWSEERDGGLSSRDRLSSGDDSSGVFPVSAGLLVSLY